MGSDDDHDRAAILARRQRFIAIALSSLAAACTGRTGKPQPCLSPEVPDPTQGEQPPEDPPATDTAEGPTDPTDAAPQVCLMVVKPR